jgi:hypothetical protein
MIRLVAHPFSLTMSIMNCRCFSLTISDPEGKEKEMGVDQQLLPHFFSPTKKFFIAAIDTQL